MLVKTKNQNVHCNIYRDKEGVSDEIKFFRIIATNDQNYEIGNLNFSCKKNREVWLYQIATKEEFQYQGIGQAMLDVFEVFCSINSCSHIEGRFIPDNDYAETFYHKNGYSIFEDSYRDYIIKDLRCSQVFVEKSPKIEGELCVLDYAEYQKQQEAKNIVSEISKNNADKKQQKQNCAIIQTNNFS